MPTVDNNEKPHVFDADGARRIVDVVRRVEAMPRNLRRPLGDLGSTPPFIIWLAQNSDWQVAGGNATTWTIYTAAGTTKDSEAATSITAFSKNVFCREGCVYPGITYSLYWVDGNWEVMNPSQFFRGKTTATVNAHAADSNGIDVYTDAWGAETQVAGNPRITGVYNSANCAINSGKFVTCRFSRSAYVNTAVPWEIIVADTS